MARYKQNDCVGCEVCTGCKLKDDYEVIECDECGATIDTSNMRASNHAISTQSGHDFCCEECFNDYLDSEYGGLDNADKLELCDNMFNDLEAEAKADYLGIDFEIGRID